MGSMFENASHLVINGGQFTASSGHGSSEDPSVKELLKHCAMEATHQSATAAYAPKCKPGTREQIIQDIMKWVDNNDPKRPILWFPGSAGGGKTCIQREVAQRCEDGGVLGASYFFSTRVANLDNAKPFVATVVQQLVERIPPLRPHISQAIRSFPSLFQKSLDEQLQHLVLAPLKAVVHSADITQYRVLPIDGFDECRDEEERKHLLQIIHTLATNPIFQFRIILASRPEYDIRTAFGRYPLQPLTHVIRLENYNGDNDIRDYLCDEFAKIRESHPSASSIPPNWPSESNVGTIVHKASSQFIFAATVIRYVENRRRSPVTSLRHILESSESNPPNDPRNPLAQLDQLYRFILHPPDVDIALLRRLLHAIMSSIKTEADDQVQRDLLTIQTPDRLDQFLGLEAGTTNIALCDVHSLLLVPMSSAGEPTRPITFYHKSSEDFLRSPLRGGDLYQSSYTTLEDLFERCIFQISNKPPKMASRNSGFHPVDHAIKNWLDYARSICGAGSYTLTNPMLLNFDPTILLRSFCNTGTDQTNSRMKLHTVENVPDYIGKLKSTVHLMWCRDSATECIELCRRIKYICDHFKKIPALCTAETPIASEFVRSHPFVRWTPSNENLCRLFDPGDGKRIECTFDHTPPVTKPSPYVTSTKGGASSSSSAALGERGSGASSSSTPVKKDKKRKGRKENDDDDPTPAKKLRRTLKKWFPFG